MLDTTLILQICGFVVCFILLFVFTAKYRATIAHETEFEPAVEEMTVATGAQPTYKPRAAVLNSLQNVAPLEVADLKEKIKGLQYQLEEVKISHEKNNAELAKQLARLETRVSTFEQEFMTKLQPTLLGLIKDLENMKVAEEKGK